MKIMSHYEEDVVGSLDLIPNMADELNRKAYTTFERIMRHFHQGKLSHGQMVASIDTLFEATSGLVEDDFIRLISDTRDRLLKDPIAVTILLNHPETGRLMIIRRRMIDPTVEVLLAKTNVGDFAGKKEWFDPADHADKRAKEYIDGALRSAMSKGFQEY